MNKKGISKILFLCAISLQICSVLSIPLIKEMHIRSGKTITVKTIPVDPRSLFRGDYIVLNYEFSRLDLNKIKHDKNYFHKGQRVFVKLAKVRDNWEATQISTKPFKDIRPNEVMLAGSVDRWPLENFINLTYGIESYFVPEGRGKYIERKISKKKVTVELSVDKKGFASVRKIFIDGKEVKFR